jgi:hypothetical protein
MQYHYNSTSDSTGYSIFVFLLLLKSLTFFIIVSSAISAYAAILNDGLLEHALPTLQVIVCTK